jgi:hypothetical protein
VTEYLHAGARQFGFMLRGLRELEPRLEALNIPFFLVKVGAHLHKGLPVFIESERAPPDCRQVRASCRWGDAPWGGRCQTAASHRGLMP